MKVTKRQLKRIIREEAAALEVESPVDVEAIEDVWGGDPEGKDRNLVLPIDHSKATKGPPATREPEVLPVAEPVLNNESSNRLQVYRGKKDLGRSYRLPPIVFERYYNAYAAGHMGRATDILEEHLDNRVPGWIDYEWRY